MTQLLVRGATTCTTCVQADLECSVSGLMQSIEDCTGIPTDHQSIVYGGRQLAEHRSLGSYGISAGSTVQLVYRLLGGKGGFGALLRGQGRDGKVTDNFDACRDLSGRRVRHQVAEEKLRKWQEQAKERELEHIAMKHIKEEARKARRAVAEEVDVEAIRSAQQEAITRTQKAVQDALATTTGGSSNAAAPSTIRTTPANTNTAAGIKRKGPEQQLAGAPTAQATAAPQVKKSKMLAFLEDVGSESSDDSEVN